MAMGFPAGFMVPMDQGGPGEGLPISGFGGDPTKTRDEHMAAVRSTGKAPVILIHGNSSAIDMLDLKRMLFKAGYPEEAMWAPSYLGTGVTDLETPHTDNVNEVRDFIDNVCEYLDVEVVDIIAYGLGCTLAYAILRGLRKQNITVLI